MKVVSRRVDALSLAFRVALAPTFVIHLQERAAHALKHGRADVIWNGTSWGELRYSRAARVYHLTTSFCAIHIDLLAPGKTSIRDVDGYVVEEPGWTVEIKWNAQTLAVRTLASILEQGSVIAELMGNVYEMRLRRIDLCADVAGWVIKPLDRKKLVKRSRAIVGEYEPEKNTSELDRKYALRDAMKNRVDAPAETHVFSTTKINGITVGRDAMQAKIYDKAVELQRHTEKQSIEHARWLAGGWGGCGSHTCEACGALGVQRPEADAEAVTRVEFQIRGIAVKEWGLRNPAGVMQPETVMQGKRKISRHVPMIDLETGEVVDLPAYIDRIWQSCLNWVRLVTPKRTKRGRAQPVAARLEDDPRWKLLRDVTFTVDKPPAPTKRVRVRGRCSTAQALGTMFSILGSRGQLAAIVRDLPRSITGGASENEADYPQSELELRALLARFANVTASEMIPDLLERWERPAAAIAHLATLSNAAIARFSGMQIPQLQQPEARKEDANHGRGIADGQGVQSQNGRVERERDEGISPYLQGALWPLRGPDGDLEGLPDGEHP